MKKDVAVNCENTFPDADRPSKTRDLTYVALGVAVVTVCAWISIPVGDVPFTLQTLAVAAIGGILGWKKGLLTILIYILLGLIGVPVFAGFKSGVPALMGATGGYIFGFAFAVVISGLAKLIPVKNKFARIGVFFAANILGLNMAWTRAVCGRLEMRYRYSKDIVYNNFPWCNPTPEQKALIEQTAQSILDARALYPDCSLADLYDEVTMPPELRKAHQANDRAVMKAYGFDVKTMTESSCVAELMKMYKRLADK